MDDDQVGEQEGDAARPAVIPLPPERNPSAPAPPMTVMGAPSASAEESTRVIPTAAPAFPITLEGTTGPRHRPLLIIGGVVALVLFIGGVLLGLLAGGGGDEVAESAAVDGSGSASTPPPTTIGAGAAIVEPIGDSITSSAVTVATVDGTLPTSAPPQPTTTVSTTVAPTTVVATTVVPTTLQETTLPPTTVLPTTTTTVPGDLQLSQPMQRPECDNQMIVLVAAAVTPGKYEEQVADALRDFEGASYLRTDQTCLSLRQNLNGDAIYVLYFGPYPDAASACGMRSQVGGRRIRQAPRQRDIDR